MRIRDVSWLRVSLWFVKVFLLVAVGVGAYWWWWLKPAQAVPQVLADIEPLVAERYFNLLEHRLAWQELARLDPLHGDFAREREGLSATLRRTLEEGLILVDEPYNQIVLQEVAFGDVRKVRESTVDPFVDLQRRHKQLLIDQRAAVKSIADFEDITGKLATYQAVHDVGSLDLATNMENLIARLMAAQRGLRDALVALDRFEPQTAGVLSMRTLLAEAITSLDELDSVSVDSDRALAETQVAGIRDRFSSHFTEIKDQVFKSELSLLQQDATLVLLAEEANVVEGYAQMLEQIDWWQAKLYREAAARER